MFIFKHKKYVYVKKKIICLYCKKKYVYCKHKKYVCCKHKKYVYIITLIYTE